jgi:signal transduction histidine kinase
MKTNAVAFRARARTIDHLGKGQIADCPTAVSELWKNSFDAYARDVALHMFDGEYKCGAIIDNGCGMTMNQLIDSWLVVGTESKSKKKTLNPEDRFGLPERKTQGEKGIGRLSSAFLAPVTLLVTKKIDTSYSAALIDWRLFENSYLSLSDISVPIVEFDDLSLLVKHFEQLLLDLKKNLCIANDDKPTERTVKEKEIRNAWEKFSQDQIDISGNQKSGFVTTEEKITSFCNDFKFQQNIANSWTSLLNTVEKLDGASHGTALFLLDLERDLSLLTHSGERANDDQELAKIKEDLVSTLRAFVNPFDQENIDFNYEIIVYGERENVLLKQVDVLYKQDFLNLEHVVQGVVDHRGWFTGTVKAFGIDKGEISFAPTISFDRAGSKVGAFKINIASLEEDLTKSSHTASEHAFLSEQREKYAGLMIFRDSLRVLPYGRIDNDFFEMEERRSRNAGRYFWSKRRIFGQIVITQDENSLLKDKAGREGFIKNQAARELKNLVENILISLADRFFGSKSEVRQEMLEILGKEKEARKAAQTKAKRQSQKTFAEELKQQTPALKSQLETIKQSQSRFENANVIDSDSLAELDQDLQNFESVRGKLRIPVKPPKIGDFEDKYRSYRDMYAEYSAHISSLKEVINKFESELNRQSPVQTAKKHFERNQALLNAQVNRHINTIATKLDSLSTIWNSEAKIDRSKYYQDALHIVKSLEDGADLEASLNNLDVMLTNSSDNFSVKYEAILRALDRLENGINLESAFSMAEEEKSYFEDKAKSVQALAQLGISVEILAHELEELDSMVTSGLNSLPSDIKNAHPGFKTAFNAHKALTQQIRFLSPLKLSGYQVRKEIKGNDIQDHIEKFFRDRFTRQRVEVIFGEAFLKMSIIDLPSRIYPVFVNLINNALYWVCLSEQRSIQIDVIKDEVIIANSGPPIDEDDIPRLFELFYTKRSNGHGVGLYLCKENLAVAHHKIRYSAPGDVQLISGGANFIITFSGMEIEQ